ncbi:unnamed protein product, partial [Rotaria socialis]
MVAVEMDDMPEQMRNDAIDVTKQAFRNYTVQRDIADCIRQTFEAKYRGLWICIVGERFGTSLTHDEDRFI